MTKRLQVLLEDAELRTIQRLARRDKLTTAEWVRRRLREGAAAGARPDTATRLAAIHAAYRHVSTEPAPDIDQMLDEIERGYLRDGPASMILVDSNIPMYLVGAAHPNREAARRALEEAVADGESLCSDAEVLQEILHRYTAIRRPEEIDPAFDALLAIVDVVYPVERADVERARRLLRTTRTLSARDAAPCGGDAGTRH